MSAAGVLVALGLGVLRDRGPEAPAVVATGPVYRGTVHAHDGAQFIRVGEAPDEIVRLTQGTITVEVEKLQPGERFRVVTADGKVEVRGTAFDVTANDDILRSVRVLHGRVEVRPDERPTVLLHTDETWSAEELAVVDEPVPAPVPEPAPVVSRRPAKAKATIAPPAPAQPAAAADAATARRRNEILFQEGWAALDAGEPKRAARAFERAARAAPDDPLAEDAWFWRGAALARLGETDGLTWFLDHYPRSPRAGEASAILGWLLLEADDLDGAEARFRAAAKDRVDSVRNSANKGLKEVAKRR